MIKKIDTDVANVLAPHNLMLSWAYEQYCSKTQSLYNMTSPELLCIYTLDCRPKELIPHK